MLTNAPSLSYFVVDSVHDRIIVLTTLSGPANTQVTIEHFVAFDNGTIATNEGAAFCDDNIVQLNSSGQGAVLVSFDRNVTFNAKATNPQGPFLFLIDHEDRLVSTLTSGAGTTNFSLPSHPTLPGDFNLNGNVDSGDYVIWRRNQGATIALYTQGDGDFDGDVDQADYGIWRANFGQTP